MVGLQASVFLDDWWRWDLTDGDAVISTPSGLMRRSKFRDTDFTIDNEDVVGLALTLSEDYDTELKLNGVRGTSSTRVGAVAIMAPGQSTSVRLAGDARFLLLGLSMPPLVGNLAESLECDLTGLEFTTLFGVTDLPLEKALFRLAVAGAEEKEQAVLAVASRLVMKHSSLAQARSIGRLPQLTFVRLQRVLDKVEEELTRPLSLLELASVAGISPFHFAREFQRSTGFAPHQYVVKRRIDRAVQLLGTTQSSITEIAQLVGFHRGSHMARHMRKLLGLTPAQLRQFL